MVAQPLHVAVLLSALICQSPTRLVLADTNMLHLHSGTAANLTRIAQERGYSQNSLCRQNNCINPLFPGLNDLPRLEALQWQCSTRAETASYMDFCKDVVIYDPALPSPVKEAKPVDELVKAQDDAAMTMFVYHLSGLGYEAWDYQRPGLSDSDCVRSVWKMVCFTYFPRAEAGCEKGQQSLYKRPCHSCCKNYIQHCGVECCDESVQCSFAHTKASANGGTELVQTGYVDVDGPSAACTGAARRAVTSPLLLILAIFSIQWAASTSSEGAARPASAHRKASLWRAVARRCTGLLGRHLLLPLLSFLAVSLQGCTLPTHAVANWQAKPDYLAQYSFVPTRPGRRQGAILNSCNVPDIPASQRCNGRGYCEAFTTSSASVQQSRRIGGPLAFCKCEEDWADPECGTRRKSQSTAFFYSLFLGYLGADYFYLGFPGWGIVKLSTLGGCGFWWITDVIRTASGPIYAYNFRTVHDLQHWVGMLIIVAAGMVAGFLVGLEMYLSYRSKKRFDLALLHQHEEKSLFHKKRSELGLDWARNTQQRTV